MKITKVDPERGVLTFSDKEGEEINFYPAWAQGLWQGQDGRPVEFELLPNGEILWRLVDEPAAD